MELLSKAVRRKRRPNFTAEFKKQLAQRASEPGVSVSLLAQENNINVNMLFKWRRQLREGQFDGVAHRQAMLPVTIVDEPLGKLRMAGSTSAGKSVAVTRGTAAVQSGDIEILMGGATVRIDGKADLTTLRAVLEMLRP